VSERTKTLITQCRQDIKDSAREDYLDDILQLIHALETAETDLAKSDAAFAALKQQHASADVELVNLKASLKE